MKSPLSRFILLVLAWLPVTFAVWYVLAPIILWPVQVLVAVVCNIGLHDLVASVDAHGATLNFITRLNPGSADAGGILSVDVNMLLYAFGLPLFAALTLAAREIGWWRRLLIGYAAMLPFIVWGVVADFLKNIAVTASPLVTSQTGFSALDRDIIVFAFQFGSLILPAVVPAIAWVLMHRAFLEGLRGPRSGVNSA